MINVALCSFGSSGWVFHAPFIHAHPGFNLYGVWERSKKLVAQKYPETISFDSYEALLADSSIELVVVNTPNYTHYEFARLALLANKHVLVEKAFTVTVSEAEELISLAKERKRNLSVFHNRRFDSDFKTVKKVFEDGALGRIVEAEFRFERYNTALSPKLHKEIPNPGSGLLHDLGPHIIDQCLMLFGMPEYVFGVLKILRPMSVVNDYFNIQLLYPLLTVSVKGSMMVKEAPVAYALHGINGSFIKSRCDVQEDVLKLGKSPLDNDYGFEKEGGEGILHIQQAGLGKRTLVPAERGNYMEFYNALYESIAHNAEPPVTGSNGLNVMKVIEAVILSDRSGTVVSCNK